MKCNNSCKKLTWSTVYFKAMNYKSLCFGEPAVSAGDLVTLDARQIIPVKSVFFSQPKTSVVLVHSR